MRGIEGEESINPFLTQEQRRKFQVIKDALSESSVSIPSDVEELIEANSKWLDDHSAAIESWLKEHFEGAR